jgi:cystathionine beta-lyase
MEVQDVPAIVAAAHRRNVPVALDNTYAAGVLFDAFAHGVDVSMQALTKYVGGHSDLLLGTVSVAGAAAYEAVGPVYKQIGMAVSPDDCSLALRGLQTLGVRLERLEKTTLEVAQWLAKHPNIKAVLHPALPSCPGHEHWRRDFTGSSSIFSIVFDERFSPAQVISFADQLTLFKIGFSWGGVTSLVIVYPNLDRAGQDYGGRLVRLNVGLEESSDLIADLDRALSTMDAPA